MALVLVFYFVLMMWENILVLDPQWSNSTFENYIKFMFNKCQYIPEEICSGFKVNSQATVALH